MKKRSAGRPPASEALAHREAVLDAATAVFLEHGFAKSTLVEIASRSGASKQTLYSLFPSKAVLFDTLMRRYLDSMTRPVSTAVIPSDTPVEDILYGIGTGAMIGILTQQRQDLFRLIIGEASHSPDLAAEFWEKGAARARRDLKEILDRLVKEKVLSIEDTARAVDQFFGSLLWFPMIRFTLRLDLPFATKNDIESWVRAGVDTFIRAHQPNRANISVSRSTKKLSPTPAKRR